METVKHKSGYVHIVGKPNAGKSTLMNALLGDKLAIVSPKIQTTRHRILGMLSDENYQLILSDSPGVIEQPKNKMHEAMMEAVDEGFHDADVFLLMVDVSAPIPPLDARHIKMKETGVPVVLVMNKIDLLEQEKIDALREKLKAQFNPDYIVPLSAAHGFNINPLKDLLVDLVPEGPAYFPKDQLTDKSERFIAAEIIREQILLQYEQEIPYSIEVVITSFKDEEDILKIHAEIWVMRDSQKGILVGKGGNEIKRLGINARKNLEAFFAKKIFLDTVVKVKENWRDSDLELTRLGYKKPKD